MPWLTYQAAAERLGISSEAVRQLAIRHHWPRRRPNADPHGRVEIALPDDFEARPRPTVEQVSDSRLAAEVDVLRERIQAAEARADAAISLSDKTLALLTEAQARADRAAEALTGERARADALRERLAAAAAVQAEAEALRAELAERLSWSWWRRLRGR